MTEAMIDGKPAAPSSAELISRAESLIPLLRANANLADQLGRVPDENVKAIEEAGLFRMLMPAKRGGYGTGAATAAAAMTHIASGRPSTAWVMQIYSGIGRMAESLPEQTLAEIYTERPNARFSGTFAAPGAVCEVVDGGCRIRGRGSWPFNSGCHHADWDLLRVSIEERDGTTSDAFCLIPLSELTIADDWHVMGAAGTGNTAKRAVSTSWRLACYWAARWRSSPEQATASGPPSPGGSPPRERRSSSPTSSPRASSG